MEFPEPDFDEMMEFELDLKTCNRCGAGRLHWEDIDGHNGIWAHKPIWRLCDEKNRPHKCVNEAPIKYRAPDPAEYDLEEYNSDTNLFNALLSDCMKVNGIVVIVRGTEYRVVNNGPKYTYLINTRTGRQSKAGKNVKCQVDLKNKDKLIRQLEYDVVNLRNELQKKIDDLNQQIKETTIRLNNLNKES